MSKKIDHKQEFIDNQDRWGQGVAAIFIILAFVGIVVAVIQLFV